MTTERQKLSIDDLADAKVQTELRRMSTEAESLRVQIDSLEAALDDYKKAIHELMSVHRIDTLTTGAFDYIRSSRTTQTLDKTKLLGLGVSAHVIEQATVSKTSPTFTMRKVSPKD